MFSFTMLMKHLPEKCKKWFLRNATAKSYLYQILLYSWIKHHSFQWKIESIFAECCPLTLIATSIQASPMGGTSKWSVIRPVRGTTALPCFHLKHPFNSNIDSIKRFRITILELQLLWLSCFPLLLYWELWSFFMCELRTNPQWLLWENFLVHSGTFGIHFPVFAQW